MIDWERVVQLREEVGPENFAEVVEIFLEEVDEVTRRMTLKPDLARLSDDLHFLKGSAVSLGFEHFGALCSEGERLARCGQADLAVLGRILASYQASRRHFVETAPSLAA